MFHCMRREQTLAEDISRDARRAEREREEALAAVTETRRFSLTGDSHASSSGVESVCARCCVT